MSSDSSGKIEGIERLVELLDAGQITHDEYSRLKAQVIHPATDMQHAINPATDVQHAETPKMPFLYTISLILGAGSFFLELFAIAAVVVSLISLLAYKMKQGRWMAWVGLSLGAIYLFVYLAAYGYIQ